MKSTLRPAPKQPAKANATTGPADPVVAPPRSATTPERRPTDGRRSGRAATNAYGINAIAGIQILVGAVMVVTFVFRNNTAGQPLTSTAAGLLPPVLLIASGVGLIRRTGWGWWSACALFYFGWIQAFMAVASGLAGVEAVELDAAVPVLAVFTIVLMYLNQAGVMAVVQCPESIRPVLHSRVTPATAGFLLALLLSIPHVIGR